MIDMYIIRAECRDTKKRIKIAGPMFLKDAQNWKPSSFDKKLYRYFRIVKYVVEGGKR